MVLKHILNLGLNQKKMRSERHVFFGNPNPRKAILKRNLSQKTRTSASIKNARRQLVTTRKIPYLCYGLSLKFLFSGVSLESGTQCNVVYIGASNRDGPLNFFGKSKQAFCSKAKL